MLVSKRRETSQGSPFSQAGAVGPDAKVLAERLLLVLANLRSARRCVAFSELYDVFEQCGQPGWDGDEAVPVPADVFAVARDFLGALPTGFPSPEVVGTEDGGIGLDWFPSPASNFSIVVLPGRQLIYASVAPGRRIRGVESFDAEVPDSILSELRRLF